MTNDENHHARTTGKAVATAARLIGYVVYFYVLVVEVLLFLGFFLLLFGANQSAGFSEWVYRSVDRAMKPFRGLFTPIELGTTAGNDVESVFEPSVLFAMIVYGIVALAVHALLGWLTYRLRRIEREEQTEEASDLAHQRSLELAQVEAQARIQAEAARATAPVAAPNTNPAPDAVDMPTAPAPTGGTTPLPLDRGPEPTMEHGR